MYLRRHSREGLERGFSGPGRGLGGGGLSGRNSGDSSGAAGESISRLDGRGELETEDGVEIVWYVLTGRRSTMDLGARQRRRRMRDRINSNA